MIHQPLGGFQGQAADMEIHAKEMLETRDRLNKILAKHTGQSVDRIKQDTDRDRFMSWEEAARYGLIDRVLEKRGEVPPDAAQARQGWKTGLSAPKLPQRGDTYPRSGIQGLRSHVPQK